VTEKTLRDSGLRAAITPDEYTVEKLARAITGHFGKSRRGKNK
jgi:hypothetical protein